MPEKILVVDDEPDLESLIRQRFRKKIKEGAYEFVFAGNGLEALAKLIEHNDIGLILSDINMPEMDGLTLLAKLNELKNPTLRTVIVSAYGDMDNIRTAMNRGAYDFVTKPVDFNDLELTIEKTINELKATRNSIQEHDQLLALKCDLETARSIQAAILPKVFPPFPEIPEFDLYAIMEPAKEVGGDFYDFFLIDNDRIGFVMGDVSGKGIPAAIFMAVSRTLIRATAIKGLPPNECLFYANNLLCLESSASMFVTVFYGILNFKTRELEYANGGHNPPYIIKPSGEVKIIPPLSGLVLGAMEEFKYKSSKMILEKGDKIFTFTDGVTEAVNETDELYTEARLVQLLQDLSSGDSKFVTEETVKRIHEYSSNVEQSDDITILTLEIK